jgi:uncharacterized protein (DUF3820 family)
MQKLTDLDKMPFGKYKGVILQEVPASYLHWMWTNGFKENRLSDVGDYIRRNLSALKQEYPDGLWE